MLMKKLHGTNAEVNRYKATKRSIPRRSFTPNYYNEAPHYTSAIVFYIH